MSVGDRWLVALCLAMLASRGMAAQAQPPVTTLEVEGRLQGVEVAAGTALPSPCFSPTGWRWGSEGECPRNVLARLEVRWRGHEVFTPVSAFADLGNPRRISLRKQRDGFDVVVEGGDAATNYRSLLEYRLDRVADEMRIVRRVVRHGEFPDEVWEETKYAFHRGQEPPIR